MRKFRQSAGMRAWIGATTSMAINVKVSQDVDGHQFGVTVQISPEGKSTRFASAGEVMVRLQDISPFYVRPVSGSEEGKWRTIEQSLTGAYSPQTPATAFILRQPRLDPGNYRITAQHMESQAEVGREFIVASSFLVGVFGPQYLVHAGSDMPADFQQPILRQPFSGVGAAMPSADIPNVLWDGQDFIVE